MRLIHLTVRRFQYSTADANYIASLAEQFHKQLGDSYQLIVGNKSSEQFKGMKIINLRLATWKTGLLYYWLPYLYMVFWLPYFLLFKGGGYRDVVFFSSDQNLLVVLIWCRKIFQMKFKICSDWHMLYDDFRDRVIPRDSDYLITTSEKLRRLIINRSGIIDSKILTVYGGVDFYSYQKIGIDRLALGLPQDKILVSYVGLFKTMGMEKGIKTMIESLKYLNPTVMMVFVGAKSGQVEEYMDLAKNLFVADRCLFVEMQPVARVPLYESAMDILVIPYPDEPHFRKWGFPMKIYEYMASRRSIIYSRLELTEEVAADCGFDFLPGDPEDLAAKINYVTDEKNTEEALRKIEIAYSKANDFSWEAKVEKILSLFK